ncbi:Retinoic acid induced 16-like protein-domain-containing protein [Talaromyces proteolyticus]|uniref:Retinoic acid induced 16-like protein-domain-containing protein n=1 Tax=Talaromyces proteolyticus TaxID=1131652 RepID=A0AAD4KET5_9EURO|nr:Retinoic acid induced 16-like protein-domain-containing protein [Talaromyces proteolyticus]KAH8690258.1 Retinoic acid induced 16-like protein-domain-containing protein [Talaromyces proteolyticus]
MDFWSRLVGGSRNISKIPRTTTPVERLTAFKRSCNALQQIWRTSNSQSSELAATVHARSCIDRLNHVLSDESRGPAPHPCLSYASTSQIFVTVTKLSITYRDEGLVRSATIFFNTLIDAEVDGVVDNRVFSRALVDLVRRNAVHTEDVESRLVELLFGVANNIRLRPNILTAWFIPKQPELPERELEEDEQFAGVTRRDDFPLFYLLVDYVHREGRTGDFARTGLLYLIDSATRSRILEKWMMESDLATLMATGLGALYSQLSRNVRPTFAEGNVPTIIALSDENDIRRNVPTPTGADFESFMSYLLFWQDTIDHCRSKEVNDTLLDHFQVLFLQQLLYPSLLESSDVKGGSTSAVLTYLCRILESIDQPELIHRTLNFLLASPTETEPAMEVSQQAHNKHMSVSRRKSIDLLAAFTEEHSGPSPSLFNLADLILMSLKSQNKETIVATLRLVTVILRRHHSFAGSLIKTAQPTSGPQRSVGALNAEIKNYISLATTIFDDPSINDSYQNYSKDATLILESRLFIPSPRSSILDGPTDQPLDVRVDDPIFKEILNLAGNFFANSVTVNLALTEVIASLASSNLVSLNKWLLVDPSDYDYEAEKSIPLSNSRTAENEEDGNTAETDRRNPHPDPLEIIRRGLSEPSWSEEKSTPITKLLRKLVSQVEQWQSEIPDFDILVAARRDLLHLDDAPTEPSTAASRQTSQPPVSRSVQPDQAPLSPRGRPVNIAPEAASIMTPGSLPRSTVGSPFREPALRTPDSRDPSRRPLLTSDFRRRLASPYRLDSLTGSLIPSDSERNSTVGNTTETATTEDEEDRPSLSSEGETVTLGHILTNAVVLYEFILELTAVIQARATVFEEAGFSS